MENRFVATAVVRACVVAAIVVALAASASAPKEHQYAKSMDVPATYDAAWAAVIEVFADQNWAINNLEKDSGLITTDWMRFPSNEPFADCGGSGLSSVVGREIRFNVLVREQPAGADVTVNATFREQRSWDNREWYVDCSSTGNVEALIHRLVSERLAMRRRAPPPPPVAAPPPAPPAPAPVAAPSTPADGTAGGHCYGNDTCNAGLVCDDILKQCVAATTQPAP